MEARVVQQTAQPPGDALDLLPSKGQQVLLVNPPVYDTRFHWPRWQQPTLLLKLAARCRDAHADPRLIDMMYRAPGERLRRERVSILNLDGTSVNKWRFGPSRHAFVSQLRSLAKEGWRPDTVYIECFTTFWWEGAAEAARTVRERFPDSRLVILGAYAELAPEHATTHAEADAVLRDPGALLATASTDLSLYPQTPGFAFLSLGDGARSADEVVAEVVEKAAKRKTKHFAFAEHAIARRFPELYRAVLEGLATRGLRVNFYAFGNVAAADFVEWPDLADLMKRAGYAQIYFADDRNSPSDPAADEELVASYRQAAAACHRAGFRERTDALTAMLSLGRPDEDLAARARVATLAAHHVGAVAFTPYQPLPYECPITPLERQNGKLFPLRHRNGHTYRDYLDVMGLAVVLNAKYRTRTFDFLGDGLIPRLFRDSIAREAWDPDPEVKGGLRLPVLERR